SKNLAQAEVEYRDWVEFFPDDALSDDIYIKMAEIHLRQVLAHNRDISHARFAEQRLKEMLRRYPNSDRKEEVEQLMIKVQEILAMHELEVARFNYVLRRAAQGAQIRTEEILNKYPNFSRLDEALWIHAQSMIIQEDTETASRDLTRLVTNYPHSEFRQKAEALLKEWGKPVPEPDPAKLAEGPPEGKGMISRTFTFLFGPKIDTSPKGVIIDRDLKPEEITARAQELVGLPVPAGLTTPSAGTTSNTDSRPRRAAGATQDVEVKPADKDNSSKEKPASKDSKKDDKKSKDKKKPDNSSKVLRNP
ncbi:MAG TPA: outer membrane protein assembly factor BamD, partial [Blastocatellia bacterium]